MQAGPLIIDEAQRSAKIALALKRTVDESRRMGQFVLTGSSNILASSHVADSLAGRVQTMTMLPMSVAETKRMGAARASGRAPRSIAGPLGANAPGSRHLLGR
ncbi:AAA family ATPase [Rhizobium laguerreae]|uniref:AAA family ATPase n=1 Tax=Rhizobium laguerreae TaxID=1076926 RepID=UPI0028C47573|nr:AAA family ATPase [Rhizobium laguerreae]